ncbi:MAG: universal stress protein [Firmicutes bacterium]|nr:universal stress protein [Bacillota bacterium]
MRKILVAVDGSAESNRALDVALELARALRAEVGILHVFHMPEQISATGKVGHVLDGVRKFVEEGGRETLERARARAADAGVPHEVKGVWGHPAEEICREAGEGRYDLVVLGSRGLGPVETWFLGSISQRVVRRAPCSVMVVR